MSLIGNLLRGTAGLAVQSKGLEVTGRNLANVNTAGYSRQTVQVSAGETMMGRYGPEAMSVQIEAVTHARDQYLDRQVTWEKSMTGYLTAEQDISDRTQTALGQTVNSAGEAVGVDSVSAGEGGISGQLSAFFNAVHELSANPREVAARNTVLDRATSLVDAINDADQHLQNVQDEATEKIGTDLTSVNQLLRTIADLNEKIGRFEVTSSGSALDLRDQRQGRLEELSAYMNFEARPNPPDSGQLEILVKDTGGADVSLVKGATVSSDVTLNGSTFQAGSPAVDLALTGGSMLGTLSARDGIAQSIRDDLSHFAQQLRTSANAAYNPSGTGSDFFAAGTGSHLIELASGLTVNSLATTATGDAGGNELALALAGVADQRFSTSNGDQIDGTLGGFFAKTVTRVGNAAQSASDKLEDQQLSEKLALSRREEISGVSLDEETANLMKYQRAFQASARYINVIDQMLDTVVNGLGHT